MQIAGLISQSIVDGPGFRYTVFMQGCSHKCVGCHNQKTWDVNGGTYMDIADIVKKIKNAYYIDGVTISGGEPFDQICELILLLQEIKDYNIICYTGYTYEQICNSEEKKQALKYIDVLIDGKFEIEKKDISKRFIGSNNQRIIDVDKSIKENAIVLMKW